MAMGLLDGTHHDVANGRGSPGVPASQTYIQRNHGKDEKD